mgnify:CR=1 FL=1
MLWLTCVCDIVACGHDETSTTRLNYVVRSWEPWMYQGTLLKLQSDATSAEPREANLLRAAMTLLADLRSEARQSASDRATGLGGEWSGLDSETTA